MAYCRQPVRQVLISICSAAAAIVAVVIARKAIKVQVTTELLAQLSEKARESNCYVTPKVPPRNESMKQTSGILWGIVTAKQIMDIHQRHHHFNLPRRFLIDNFVLTLNTSIRHWIVITKATDLVDDQTLRKQFETAKTFLTESPFLS